MTSKQPPHWWQQLAQELDAGAALVALFLRQLHRWRMGSVDHRYTNRMPRCYGRQTRRRRKRRLILVVQPATEDDADGC